MSFLTSDIQAPRDQIKSYRADIDGLKAIAVLAVILFHYFSNALPGGFVGVDIFFVISGYLIGKSTFAEIQAGSYSVAKYFGRRARRIFPSLILLLVVILVAGFFILLPNEFKSLGKHIAGASVFISNWILWRETGYFDSSAEDKPLLNLWSLGVEEQFYLVFPLLVFLMAKINKRAFLLLAIVAIASLVLTQVRIHDHVAWAYYHPISRLWELLAGSLLAYFELHRIFQRAEMYPIERHGRGSWSLAGCSTRSVLGLSLIGAALFLYSRETVFPGVTALLPVAGAVLIISSGTNSWLNRKLLSHRVLVYIGIISYPLYLWHWPILSFIHIVDNAPPPVWLELIVIALTVAISVASYHFVERPLRFGRFAKVKFGALLLWGVLLCIGALGFYAYKTPALDQSAHQEMKPSGVKETKALDDHVKTVALIGNSHAGLLKDSLETYFSQSGRTLKIYDQGGCLPFWNLDRHDPGYGPQGCEKDINRGIKAAIDNPDIDTVVLAAKFDDPGNLYDIARPETDYVGTGKKADIEAIWLVYETAMEKTVQMLLAANKKVILIETVPSLSFHPRDCVERPVRFASNKREPCTTSRADANKRHERYRAMFNRVAQKYPKVHVFDPFPLFCNDESCVAKLNGEILYVDDNHLTDAGVAHISSGFNFK